MKPVNLFPRQNLNSNNAYWIYAEEAMLSNDLCPYICTVNVVLDLTFQDPKV